MERFCATLQRSLQSRVQPWSNLNKSLLHMIYLEQLAARYDVSEELAGRDERDGDDPIGHERVIAEC